MARFKGGVIVDRRSFIFVLVVCLGMPSDSARARVLHVDADAPGPVHDGSSWANAFRSLSAALDAALEGDAVHVAEGTYTPGPSGLAHPREATFDLPASTAVIGGYAGWGVEFPDDNDSDLYRTFLSGDLAGNDTTSGDTSENAYHVVSATTGGAILAPNLVGFTITGGNANGVGFPGNATGGGLYTTRSISVESCTFERNNAIRGGGMFNMESTPVLSRCVFRRNTADQGAGIFLFGFETSERTGDARNKAIVRHGFPHLSDCEFDANHARDRAGAIWVSGIAENPTLVNCTFSRNTAINAAGAVWASGSMHAFSNCLFSHNVAGAGGGAVHTDSTVSFAYCTLAGNAAAIGGGVFSRLVGPSFTGCIVWGNRTTTGYGELAQIEGAGSPSLAFSCIDGWTGAWGGTGNFGNDPLFVPGPIGCFYLSDIAAGHPSTSPCIDTGHTDVVTTQLSTLTTNSTESLDVGTADIGYHYRVTGLPVLGGDVDANRTRDLFDFAALQNCFTGDSDAVVPPRCRTFDFQLNGTVDLHDFGEFNTLVSGP